MSKSTTWPVSPVSWLHSLVSPPNFSSCFSRLFRLPNFGFFGSSTTTPSLARRGTATLRPPCSVRTHVTDVTSPFCTRRSSLPPATGLPISSQFWPHSSGPDTSSVRAVPHPVRRHHPALHPVFHCPYGIRCHFHHYTTRFHCTYITKYVYCHTPRVSTLPRCAGTACPLPEWPWPDSAPSPVFSRRHWFQLIVAPKTSPDSFHPDLYVTSGKKITANSVFTFHVFTAICCVLVLYRLDSDWHVAPFI